MKRIFFPLFLLAALCSLFRSSAAPAGIRFWNRALVAGSDPSQLTDAFKAIHAQFANQALIMRYSPILESGDYDPGSATAKFGLTSLLQKVTSEKIDPGSVLAWFQDWAFTPANTAVNQFGNNWKAAGTSLANIPLRPLAVANRIDLAGMGGTCDPGMVCGAELRFLYAGTGQQDGYNHDVPYFMMILEFTLHPMKLSDFVAMGASWEKTAAYPDQASFTAAWPGQLDSALSHVASARIRVNANNGTTWTFGQFTVQGSWSASHRFALVNTDQQANTKNPTGATFCQSGADKTNPLVAFIQNPANQPQILNSTFGFTGATGLVTQTPMMLATDKTVLTLDSKVLAQPQADNVRFALSINSCVGCHGSESPPQTMSRGMFDQVHYRLRGQNSPLSDFLTGGGGSGEPTTNFASVSPPLVAKCADGTAQTRQYNELVRRHLFLDALMALPATATVNDWSTQLVQLGLVGSPDH